MERPLRLIPECAEDKHHECPGHCPRSDDCCVCECECHQIVRPVRVRQGSEMNPYFNKEIK